MEKLISLNSAEVSNRRYTASKIYESLVFNILSKMTKGKLQLTLPDGGRKTFGGNDASIVADLDIKSNAFFRNVVLFGDIGFGESYVDGLWDTTNITNVISWMILNIENNPALSGSGSKFSPISLLKVLNRWYHKGNANTKNMSKKNIAEHYDLNNDFFKLWLDESMTYSSALFENESVSLHDAQIAKYDRICKSLNIKTTDHVLEIGTGWGGFAVHAVEQYGCEVTSVTISEEQYAYACDFVKKKNLSEKIHIQLMDYREITGTYDKIVSIEMLEAVGHEFLPAYFSQVNRLLKKDGAIGLQVITSHDSNYEQLRKGVDWIQKHAFPGSLLPSVGAINAAVNKTSNLYLHDLKNFGLDYARTLKEWRERFNAAKIDVLRVGFNERFLRKWNYYLSYCEAAFTMRNISVVQMVYTRPNNRNL